MLLKTKGKSYNISEPIVGKVTRNQFLEEPDYILISENSIPKTNLYNFKAFLTNCHCEINDPMFPSVYSIQTVEHLSEGDIIVINSDGIINTLYRVLSKQNFLLATERCNSNCLMCSQPPRNRNDIDYLFNIYTQLLPLIPKDCPELGITGGEPTLMGNLYFSLLKLIQIELPNSEVHCLTNGRAFAWQNIADELGKLKFERLMLGIPLYSDYYVEHDYIVQAKDAWNQTMSGFYNLAKNEVRIEIRVVLHKLTIPRLTRLAKFIYKNLPFVEHIAFMGLEYQGYTPYNIQKLWIDPVDYMEELQEAAEFLSSMGMNECIYIQ